MSFITFGEIMLRLTPSVHTAKIVGTDGFGVNYAGSESNVASSLAILGHEVSFVSKLPRNQLGDAAINSLRSYGVSINHILRGGHRIGTYFIEMGAAIRPSSVIYDRANAAISQIGINDFDWMSILDKNKWFHLSGITPALSDQCAAESIKSVQTAKEMGLKVSFDLNYRRTLWESEKAKVVFDQILAYTDIVFCNLGVLTDIYGINFQGEGDEEKTLNAGQHMLQKFNLDKVFLTTRQHTSASSNQLSAIMITETGHFVSKKYDVEVLDRFGTGDAFAAGCLHGMENGWDDQRVLDFGTAAFALKHTIIGDQHTSSTSEIESIAAGNISGHVLR